MSYRNSRFSDRRPVRTSQRQSSPLARVRLLFQSLGRATALPAVLSAVLGLASPADAAPRYEAGVLTATTATANTWQEVNFGTPFTAPPVVVLGPATFGDSQPITTRVRNVSATGFEWQIDEWDYLDGVHGQESLTYLAIEPGNHTIGSSSWRVGRVAAVTQAVQTVTFSSAVGTTPVVLAQVETVNNAKALNARVRSVTTTNFVLRTQAQESDTTTLLAESVGYIAVTPGVGSLDGSPFLAARTGTNVTQAWKVLAFGNTYRAPIFLAQSQSNSGGDPFSIRRRNLSNTGVEIFLEEETSADAEVNHSAEDVGYLVLAETQGELRAKLQFGSVAVAQANAAAWNTVTLEDTYTNPVVVFGPVTQGGADPVGVRVRNVTSSGFEWQLDEWDYLDGGHSADAVAYIVAEAGVYTIGQRRWVFGRSTGITNAASAQTFAEVFPSTPVVLPQVATVNETSAVRARVSNPSATGFTVRLEEEEAANGVHAAETVHYLALEAGNGRLLSKPLVFEVATVASVTDAFGVRAFARKYADPLLFADTQTRNEADPIVVRIRNLGVTSTEIRLQEEISANTETAHAAEALGYFALARSVDLDEDGLPDAWELANGLNPANANDAQLDSDGDGISNLNEYLGGTNPLVPESGGTVVLELLDADAYEKEGTAARVRVTRTGGAAAITVPFNLTGSAIRPGQAGADFTTKTAGGATLNGSISLGLGVASAEIVIGPVLDALNEYPETVTVTLASGSSYTLGSTISTTTQINDAAPTAANEQLFVAFLTRQGTAQTYASGIATLYLNGPRTAARVNLSFSGLTSNQTNAYIRYGVASGVGPELRPTFPIGQVVDQTWAVVPVGLQTGQDIIDALFQVRESTSM